MSRACFSKNASLPRLFGTSSIRPIENNFIRMKMKMMIAFFLGMIITWPAYNQCNNDLVEIAMAQSGPDAVFVREFKVKLQKGTTRNPTPSGKFNVFLKESTNYRFNIATGMESDGKAILQLFRNGQSVGGTYDLQNRSNSKAFDYTATKTGTFQVIISFEEGKSGCAVGIMSLIAEKTLHSDSVLKEEKEELEVLYLNVENPVSIITDKEASDSILFETDNGIILENAGSYFILPAVEGIATLKVIIKDKKGNIKEEAKSDFLVRRLPAPRASIHGSYGGIVSKLTLQLADALEINHPVDYEKYGYEIVDFTVKTGEKGDRHILNSGKKFNAVLRNILSDLPEDTRLVFEAIHVKVPGGQVIVLEPVGFIVR